MRRNRICAAMSHESATELQDVPEVRAKQKVIKSPISVGFVGILRAWSKIEFKARIMRSADHRSIIS